MRISATRRRFAPLAIAMAAALAVAACGESDFAEDSTDGADPAPADDDAPVEPASLTLMGWSSSPAEDDALNAIIDNYNEQSEHTARFNPVPEYDTALQAALAGGSPPDVVYVDSARLPDGLSPFQSVKLM